MLMSRDDYISMSSSKSFPAGISPNNGEELSFDRHCCDLNLCWDTILLINLISTDYNAARLETLSAKKYLDFRIYIEYYQFQSNGQILMQTNFD